MCFDQQMVFDTRYPFECINILRPPARRTHCSVVGGKQAGLNQETSLTLLSVNLCLVTVSRNNV